MALPNEPTDEDYSEVFDCGVLEVPCHITSWFHGLVADALQGFINWLAGIAFRTPPPNATVESVWVVVSAISNTLYALLILAAGFVIMAHHSLQAQHGAKEIIPRLFAGLILSNVSLTVIRIFASWSTDLSQAIIDSGMGTEMASARILLMLDRDLKHTDTFIVVMLLVLLIVFVVWALVEIFRVCILILLMIGGPVMLIFHALPQTNHIAQVWWRAVAAVCLIPVGQAIAFIALMEVLLADGSESLFPSDGLLLGSTPIFNLLMLIVLVFAQVKIPFWIYKAMMSSSAQPPLMSAAVGAAKMYVFRTVAAAATGGAGAAVAAGSGMGKAAAGAGRSKAAAGGKASQAAGARPRRWRFGKPNEHNPRGAGGKRSGNQSGTGGSATSGAPTVRSGPPSTARAQDGGTLRRRAARDSGGEPTRRHRGPAPRDRGAAENMPWARPTEPLRSEGGTGFDRSGRSAEGRTPRARRPSSTTHEQTERGAQRTEAGSRHGSSHGSRPEPSAWEIRSLRAARTDDRRER